MIPPDDDEVADVLVVSDSEGHDIDMNTGDIWDLDAQEIVGQKDLKTGKKTWFKEEEETPEDAEEEEDEEPEPPKKKSRSTKKTKKK